MHFKMINQHVTNLSIILRVRINSLDFKELIKISLTHQFLIFITY